MQAQKFEMQAQTERDRHRHTKRETERERKEVYFFLIMQRPWLCLLLQSSPWVGPGEWGGVAVASRTLAPGTNHQRPLKKNNACKRAADWTSCSAAALDVSASTCFFWIYYENFVRRIVVNWWVARGCVASGSTRGRSSCQLSFANSFILGLPTEDAAKSWFDQCHFSALLSDANLIQWQIFFFVCVHS